MRKGPLTSPAQVRGRPLSSTPRADQFRMPGEFEPHAGCWMLWPHWEAWWRDGAKPAQRAFAAVADAISQFESLRMGVISAELHNARCVLPSQVDIVPLAYNDAWIRDNGPTYVVNQAGERRGIDWDFNAWGGIYPDFGDDDALAAKVLARDGISRYKAPLVMEGGAIDVDGEGTLIVTEQCLLNPNRNPNLSRNEIESYLVDYLNVDKVIWLQNGVINDETSGHVDNLCCFVRPGVVALTWTDNVGDPQHAVSQAAYDALSAATDAKGRSIQVVKVHQPTPMFYSSADIPTSQTAFGSLTHPIGTRMAASYINYYVANGGVVVPQFNDPHDADALATIGQLYPEREVVGVYAREILLGGGNIHCITQQIPI